MQNKLFILDYFEEQLGESIWLLEKDSDYAKRYYALYTDITQQTNILDSDVFLITAKIEALVDVYVNKLKDPSTWITPKKRTTNELTHDESGELTEESTELLRRAITDKTGEKTLISDTGKTISFGEKWHSMLQDCGFKSTAVNKLTDFISKFIEYGGWSKYFVGNIGKNNKRLIQDYHPMDKYNLDHNTSYAAMHLGGDTTKCVLVSVDTPTSDGRGEPVGMTFLEIGAHTIIDRFIVGSFRLHTGKPITEATIEEFAALLDI